MPATEPIKGLGDGGRLLLVDDDADILESIRAFVESSLPGVQLFTATSGPEGLKILEENQVSLIVTDYKMAGMDGIEFLRRSARLAPKAGRIMITAYPDPDVAARAVGEGGAALLITKPFDPDYFVEVVRSLLASKAKVLKS